MKKKAKMKPLERRLKTLLWGLICTLTVVCYSWLASFVTVAPQPSVERQTEIYSNQTSDDLRMTFSQAIQDAQKTVVLSIYSLTDRTLINDLKKKSEEGVDVTVIYDCKASEGVHKKLGKKVNAISRKGRGLMHQKILVVDGVKSWIGSANFTPSSLRSHANLVTGFYSPELAGLLTEKAHTLANEGMMHGVPHANFTINKQPVEMWFLPENKEAVSKIKGMIRSAKKTMKIAMFTWTRHDLANEVIRAKNRGVKAEVVIDRSSGQGVSAEVVDLLFKNGIPVRLSQGDALLHHKFLIVDDRVLIHGSANWTKAAFTHNDDCFIVLHDLTGEQQLRLQQMWDVIMADSQSLCQQF